MRGNELNLWRFAKIQYRYYRRHKSKFIMDMFIGSMMIAGLWLWMAIAGCM